MKLVATIDRSWVKDLLKWQDDPDIQKFFLRGEAVEEVLSRIQRGEMVWLGLEEDSWRGFATLEPHDDQAELGLYAPGRARKAIRVICKLLENYPINKIYMKVQADRSKNWESFTKKDWDRVARFWGLQFIGLVGDPIGDKPFYFLAAKEIHHGKNI